MAEAREHYLSVAGPASVELFVKKSRFIGGVSRASSEGEALDFVARTRATHHAASHNCFAYVVGISGQYQRASDDGEPGGTAGRPILDVVLRKDLVNVVVVVTRYFGGILLGAGGLVRAYAESARLAIDAAVVSRSGLCKRLLMSLDYPLYGKVQRELESRRIRVEEVVFGADVGLTVLMPARVVDQWQAWIRDISSGAVEAFVLDESYAPVGDDGNLL